MYVHERHKSLVAWREKRIGFCVRWVTKGEERMPWSQWEDLGGQLASAPDVSSWGAKRLDVFAHGPDGAMWHNWFEKRLEAVGEPRPSDDRQADRGADRGVVGR